MKKTSRFSRSWRLAKDSWAVLKADRSLLAFPVVGSIAAVVAFSIVALPGAGVWAITDSGWTALPFAVVALYAATFVTIFTGVGLAAASAQVMDGRDATLRTGLAVARTHTGAIAKWALVQTTAGLIINVLQQMAESENGIVRLVGLIATTLISVAWALASFFVIPLIAFEGVSPGEALKRSTALIRERWGEGVAGSASIGIIAFLLGVLPAIVVGVIGVQVGGPAGIALIAIAVVVLIVTAIVANTLTQVFRVALYRFATDAPVAAGFASEDLEAAFRPKRRHRAR